MYLNQFVMPGNEKWYSFVFGNSLFICLLSQEDYTIQHNWLVNELSASTKTWKIVFFHKPFFTTGDHANDMNSYLSTWWKALDDYGVDVVLGGHTHYYLRSKPINLNVSSNSAVGEYGSGAAQGRLQIVAGSYGAPRSSIGADWFIESNVSEMNYTKFEISDNVLMMRAYNMSGSLIDSVTIHKNDVTVQIELTSFTARQDGADVLLEWVTESETDNLGFQICRRSEKLPFLEIANFKTHSELLGQGSTTKRTRYIFRDKHVIMGKQYDYQLSDIDYNGTIKFHEIRTVVINKIEYFPFSSSPNPFNSITNLEYLVPQQSFVELTVFDILGQEVVTLVNQIQDAGHKSITWNGVDASGRPVNTGVYLYMLRIGTLVQIRKTVVLK